MIVIPVDATEAEEFAAELIQEYVRSIDGSDLQIVRDSQQVGTNYEIYIGNTVNRPHADLTGKPDGSYSIKTYNNKSISIYGTGSKGTVAGAYAFLEKFGGYKFYCSEEGYKSSATHLKISGKTDIKYTPAFEVADTNYMASFTDEAAKRDYTLRAGLEGTSVESGLPEGLESNLYLLNCVESLSSGNEEEIKAEISEALNSEDYDRNAALQIIRLDAYDLEDTFAYNFNGKTSGVEAVLHQANLYSQYIKDQGATNVKLEVCIYGKEAAAPESFVKRSEVLNSNVIVRLCPYDLCEAHAITDKNCKENYSYYKNLKNWVTIAPALYVTDYTVNFMQTLPTFTCISALQTNIQAYKKAGVKGIFVSGNNEFIEQDTSFGELKAYLVNEILKNPSVSLSSKRTAFLKDYYGKKSYSYINNYIKTMDSVAKKNHITVTDMTADMYGNMSKTNKTKCENFLNNAVKKAKNDTEFHQQNIFRVQLGWRYIKSTLGYKEFAPATFAASNEALAKDFVEVSGNEVMRLGQGEIIYPCADYMNKTPDYWTLPDQIDWMEDPNEGITIPTEPVEEPSEETTEEITEEITEEEPTASEEDTELPTSSEEESSSSEEETTIEEPSSSEEPSISEEPSSSEEPSISEEPSSSETPSTSETTSSTDDISTYMNSKYPDDMPKAVIVTPVNPSAEESAAAYALQVYIGAEDGYTPQVITDKVKQGSKGFEISVGNTNRPHGKAKYSSNDSYSIKSYANGISITGVGEAGLLYGAMRLLEDCGGYYYLSWDDKLVTNQTKFKYDKNGINTDYERVFAYTDNDVCYAQSSSEEGRLYALTFGLNGFYQNSFCLGNDDAGRESWYLTTGKRNVNYGFYPSNSGVPIGYAHTILNEFLDPNKLDEYYAKHPEWFCAYDYSQEELKKNDKDRKRNKQQICLYEAVHDEELYGMILQHCHDMIDAGYDPNAEMQIISVSNMDNQYLCMCSQCIKDRVAHGDKGGMNSSYDMLELLNKLSADIHKGGKYQNVYLDTLAYTWTLNAPTGMTADDHVIIRWAPINRCYGHYLDSQEDSRNKEYYEQLKGWLKVSKHVWIWDYNTNFRTTLQPYANVDVMQHDIKLYKELGIEGVYLQSNYNHSSTNSEFGDIRNYIEGRMLQDPSRDYEKELEFFTYAYYGDSAPYVCEYMKRMEKQMANHHQIKNRRDDQTNYDSYMYSIYGGCRTWDKDYSIANRMPDAEIGACESLWNEINTISKTESPEVQTRLKKLELSWRLVKSTLNVYEFSNSTTYASENQKLIDDIKSLGITKFALINDYKMSQCRYPQNHPDNWIREKDNYYGEFVRAHKTTAKPTIPSVDQLVPKTEHSSAGESSSEKPPVSEEPSSEEMSSEEVSTEEVSTEEPSIEEPSSGEEPITEDPIDKPSIVESSEEPSVEEPVSEITDDTEYVTYKMFGAKGDGKTDDYAAIVATHAYANEHNLPVKADRGAVYYVRNMDSKNKEGALIKTNTDWTGAEFVIDDRYIDTANRDEAECFLFTVAPSISSKKMWYLSSDGKLGLDPSLSSYPTYPEMSKTALSSMKNKAFTKDTTKLEGNFGERALYLLESNDEKTKRWARQNFSETARNQTEILLVNADGTIDPSTPITWDWDNIWMITKYTIDETPLTVKGGKFTTRIALPDYGYYLNRGLHITRSNAVVEGVEHYLDESGFDPKGFDKDGYVLEQGSQYYGFFQVDNCAYTTMKNCIMSDRAFVHNKDGSKRSSYEFTSTNSAAFTLKDCTMATPINNNEYRYGTIGTNGCKSLVVDGSTVSRVDAHMGVYNMTIKNSTLGQAGVRAAGFGDLVIENVTTSSEYFLVLRDDFGGAWDGDVTIKNCTWVLNNDHPKYMYPKLIIAKCDPTFNFSYDVQDGYYTQMMSHLTVDGLTLDYSNNTQSNLYGIFAQGLEIFGAISPDGKEYSETNMNNPNIYKYARKAPEEVTVRNLKVIKPQSLNTPSLKNKTMPVFLKKGRNDGNMAKDEVFFFRNTVFNNDESTHVEVFADK